MSGSNAIAAKETLGNILSKQLAETADRASCLSADVCSRLDKVSRATPEKEKKCGVDCPAEPWPDLLSNLRESMWKIQRSLDEIKVCMDEVEI